MDYNKVKYFLPYQLRWLEDKSKVKMFVKSRRIGGTYIQSYEDVEDCLYKRVPAVWFSSADESAAREYILYCEMWAKFFDAGLRYLGESVIDRENDIKTLSVQFRNGTRINALTSSPKAFRSKGGKAILDEFAHHKDQLQMWKAAKPVTTWGYPVRILSTHNGESQFYKFQQAINEGKLNWSLHVVDIYTAVKEGLLDRIYQRHVPEDEQLEWLEREKRDCFDECTWLEEYCCRPQTGKNVFLDYPLIAVCEEAGCEWQLPLLFRRGETGAKEFAAVKEPQNTGSAWVRKAIADLDKCLKKLKPAGRLFIGFDIGRKKDLSVIWIAEKINNIKITRAVVELEGTRFWVQEEILYAFLSHPAVERACIDSTGLGMQLAERAQERFGRAKVEAVNFAAGSVRTEMAFYTKKNFEEKTVIIPPDDAVRDDLHSMKRVVTSAGNIRLEHEKQEDVTGHADRFWALSLALHASQSEQFSLIVSSRRHREAGKVIAGYF